MAWVDHAKIGDKVVCVLAVPEKSVINAIHYKILTPKLNNIYTIEKFLSGGEEGMLLLTELDNASVIKSLSWNIEGGFPFSYFRPVQKRRSDISMFTSILNSTPVKEIV